MSVTDQITKLSAARGPSVIERTVTIGDASETFKFKRLPYGEAQRIALIPLSVDPNTGKTSFDVSRAIVRNSAMIAASLCDDDGNQAVTEAQVSALDAAVAEQLYIAAAEVNGVSANAAEQAEKN